MAVFLAQKLERPRKQMKQIPVIQLELNIVKNLNWPEVNQLAIDEHDQLFELRTTLKQLQSQ